jgi:hypothetical protein
MVFGNEGLFNIDTLQMWYHVHFPGVGLMHK